MFNQPEPEQDFSPAYQYQDFGITKSSFYLNTNPDPNNMINKRVKTINDEIAKQRQYLPKTNAYQTQQNGFQRHFPIAHTGYDVPESEPNNFRNNLELLQKQQRMQMKLIEQRGSFVSPQRKRKISDRITGNQPSSIAILRSGTQHKPNYSHFNNDDKLRQIKNFGGAGKTRQESLLKNRRRNIKTNNNSYYDHMAAQMQQNLNQTTSWMNDSTNMDYYNNGISKTPQKVKKQQKSAKSMNRSFAHQTQPSVLDQMEQKYNMDVGSTGYVNYINGVPVESPIPKKKKSVNRNEKLPVINSQQRTSSNFIQDSKDRLLKQQSSQSPINVIRNSKTVLASGTLQRNQSNLQASKAEIEKSNNKISQLIKQSKSSPKKIRFDPDEEVHNIDNFTPINIVMDNIKGQKSKDQRKEEVRSSDPPKKKLKKRSQSPHHKTEPQIVNVKVNTSTMNQNSRRDKSSRRGQSSRRGGGGGTISSRLSDYKHGPLPQKKTGKRHPNNFFQFDDKYFKKMPGEPSLFNLDVDEDDVHHLLNDDVDNVSRMEIIYKILKEQLREYQKQIIEHREQERKKKEERRMRSKSQKGNLSQQDLKNFARYIKHFETYAEAQRDIDPELKRIIEKLSCQEHKFMYCPCCKNYEEQDFDPVENIQKFLNFVAEEKEKARRARNKKIYARKKKMKGGPNLENDSVGEITDLEEEDILHKYFEETANKIERRNRERKKVQDRLYGGKNEHRHICSTNHRCQSAEPKKTIKMELRPVDEGISMHDFENSAHQFSMKDQSVQDSDFLKEIAMQTSQIVYDSAQDQTSMQGARVAEIQTSELSYKGLNIQCERDRENLIEMACQTDKKITRRRTPTKKSMKIQTEAPRKRLDIYKEDWVDSLVFRRAVKQEAINRKLPYEEVPDIENEDISDESSSDDYDESDEFINPADARQNGNPMEENTQDPDTDASQSRAKLIKGQMNILKKIFDKEGSKTMLTESEVRFLKEILQNENHYLWKDSKNLRELHKHTKFTIRMLTFQMANIDNYKIFRNRYGRTRENTLQLVYRSERLYQALTDSEKIFKLLSITLFDQQRFQDIIDSKSIKKEDQAFIKKREVYFRRIMSQVNNFQETYRFLAEFLFKAQKLTEYIQIEIEKVTNCKVAMDQVKKENPDLAQAEELRVVAKVRSSVDKTKGSGVAKIVVTDIDMNAQTPTETTPIKKVQKNSSGTGSLVKGNIERDLSPLNVNKHHEQDYVGKRTIEIINMQAEEEQKKLAPGKSVGTLQQKNALNLDKQQLSAASNAKTAPKSHAKIVTHGEGPSNSVTNITASNVQLKQVESLGGVTSFTGQNAQLQKDQDTARSKETYLTVDEIKEVPGIEEKSQKSKVQIEKQQTPRKENTKAIKEKSPRK